MLIYRTGALLSVCAYRLTGRKHLLIKGNSLNNKTLMTASALCTIRVMRLITSTLNYRKDYALIVKYALKNGVGLTMCQYGMYLIHQLQCGV